MNKKSLINKVAEKTGYPRTHIEKILWPIFESITDALYDGQKITINGFGTFMVKNMPERNSRNPSTGQPIIVKAKQVVKFKPCSSLFNKKGLDHNNTHLLKTDQYCRSDLNFGTSAMLMLECQFPLFMFCELHG